MSSIKKQIASVIKTLGLVAFIAALAATAFPGRSYAATVPSNDYGKIEVGVFDSATGQAVSYANMVVLDEKGNAVLKVNLGTVDTRSFALPKGVYKVIVAADGYNKVTQGIKLNVGETQSLTFKLTRSTSQISGPGPVTTFADR